MKLTDARFLLDENIHPDVARFLLSEGFDSVEVRAIGLGGAGDREVLAQAKQEGRVVLTHDGDFGTLAIAGRAPLTGVVYLRPGHIESSRTIETLRALLAKDLEIDVPFLVVAEHKGASVRIRIRSLPDLTE